MIQRCSSLRRQICQKLKSLSEVLHSIHKVWVEVRSSSEFFKFSTFPYMYIDIIRLFSSGRTQYPGSGSSPVAADHHHLLLPLLLPLPGPGHLAAVASEEAGGEHHSHHLQETRLHRAGVSTQ